ncbi:MAG: HAD family phosphatase [Clostridia bacterium]|nr:HAD family phosphatase [Clostridia bacterium]
MLEQIKAVIFDLDGTLVDSMWMWRQIDVEYLNTYHIELPETLQNEIEGKSFTETAQYFKERFNLPETIESIKSTWNQMAYEKYKNEVKLKTGAFEFLEYCRTHNIRLGIATSNSKELLMAALSGLHIDHYFDSLTTGCDVCIGKPAPDVYLKTASDLHVKPYECLVFEDIIPGILAGKNAGMRVCAVYDKYSDYQDHMKRKLADYYINDYKQIFDHTYETLEKVSC